MRKCRIEEDLLRIEYNINSRPFWDACKDGFEELFVPQAQKMNRIAPHAYDESLDKESVKEYIISDKSCNWSWYVTNRIKYFNSTIYSLKEHYFEEQIYEWYCNIPKKKTKPVLLLHGNTGIGKTTIVKYFFSSYLKQRDFELSQKSYVFRISFPAISYDKNRIADDFDHYLYKCLIETFTSGELNLGNPSTLLEMALLEYPQDEVYKYRITYETPPPKTYPEQLKWIRDIVVGRSSKLNSDFEDFNRLAIRYLCKKDSNIRMVIFLDNVDQLPAAFQTSAWLLTIQKLKWIEDCENACFIIAVRTYMLDSALKDDELNAYNGQVNKIEILPPSLYDVLIKRKKSFFDPIYPPRPKDITEMDNFPECKLTFNGDEIPIYCPNEMLSSLFDTFKESSYDRFVSLLCNFDIRQGIEIAENTCKYPFYNWAELADRIYNQFISKKHESEANTLISFERLLDSALRRNNVLCDTSMSFFDNVYKVNNTDHFSNSLCKLFILYILRKGSQRLTDLYKILTDLGHSHGLIENALSRLLRCNIITSPQGIYLKEHRIELLSSEGTTLCEQYITSISCTLYYLQAMAYNTPMLKEFEEKVPMPREIKNDDRLFEERVLAASILLQQIDYDFKSQLKFVDELDDLETKKRCLSYLKIFELVNIVNNIKEKVIDDLNKIFSSGAYKNLNKDGISNLFLI